MIIEEMIPQTNKNDFLDLLEAFLSIWNDPENCRYLSLSMQPLQKEMVEAWFANHLDQGVRYFATTDGSGEIVGISALKKDNSEGFEIIGVGVRAGAKRKGIG